MKFFNAICILAANIVGSAAFSAPAAFHQTIHSNVHQSQTHQSIMQPKTQLQMSSTSDDLAEPSSMPVKELRAELESYGISSKSFFDKTELIEALLKAREGGPAPDVPPVADDEALAMPSPSTFNANGEFEIFPTYDKLEHIESGGTVKTYKMPLWATRVQMRLETNGRPMKGEVNLWLGPGRLTHTLKVDSESGKQFPVQATLKFKPNPTLKISTTNLPNYPMKIGVHVPSPERAKELADHTEALWDSLGVTEEGEKRLIQGSNTDGKYGKQAHWLIPDDVESVQLLGWSRDSGKKSFKVEMELIQGPNNVRQYYFLQCGGGSQPYHTVYQTPGKGWMMRIRNKKFMEDGLVQIAVLPYRKTENYVEDNSLNWN